MTIKRVKLSDALKKKGKSRGDLLKNMTDEEIHRRALDDLDNPPLTDEQLKEFELVTNEKEKEDGES